MRSVAKNDAVYIEYMTECIERIQDYTREGRAAFFASRLIQDATVRNLQTLTESSQRLSAATRARAPDIDWRAIAGFRNILVHGYLGVDIELVWRVIEQDLPALRDALLEIRPAVAGSRK